MQCPDCGASIDAKDSFCRECGAQLKTDGLAQRPAPTATPPPSAPEGPSPKVAPAPPATRLASASAPTSTRARPVGPAPAGLMPDEDTGALSLSRLIRPIAEGVAVCVLIGLLYLIIGVYVSHTYTPLIQFYQETQGLIWLALFAVGCAWASKDERENSFLTGALSGLLSGLLLTIAEILFLSAPFCLRYVLGATLAAGAVGLLAGTIAGIVGSPVMVRFPTAQKRLALLVIIGGVIPAIIMAALPQQDTFFHSSMARAYYNRQIYPLATRHFEKAYQLDPFDVSINSDLAVCYEKIGAHTAVLDHLQRAVDLDQLNRKRDPNYEPVPETYKNLAVAYYRDGGLLGDEKLIAAAAELFAEYIHVITQELPAEKKRDPEIDTFYDLINAYIALNQPDKALSAAEQAASFYPDDSKLQEQVAQLRKVVSQEPSEQPSASPSATRPSSPSGGTSEPEKPGAETTRGEEAAAAGSEEKEGRGEEKTETPSPE